MRVAPAPLYNRFEDAHRFVEALKAGLWNTGSPAPDRHRRFGVLQALSHPRTGLVRIRKAHFSD